MLVRDLDVGARPRQQLDDVQMSLLACRETGSTMPLRVQLAVRAVGEQELDACRVALLGRAKQRRAPFLVLMIDGGLALLRPEQLVDAAPLLDKKLRDLAVPVLARAR